jgi:tRNA threonylcarbamoyladenosine modification (KEOPS) complex Cgi121 subunit
VIRRVDRFNKYIGVAGFRDVSIDNVDGLLSLAQERLGDTTVQFFNADLIAGWEHLYFAGVNALKAFKNGTEISKSLAIETVLYASARRQIRVALDLVGIRSDSRRIALLIVAGDENAARKNIEDLTKLIPGERDDTVLELSDEKVASIRKLFGISDIELATKLDGRDERKVLCDLVIEHVALLVTQR